MRRCDSRCTGCGGEGGVSYGVRLTGYLLCLSFVIGADQKLAGDVLALDSSV